MSEARYNNYVQPACLWFDEIYDTLESYEITGLVSYKMNTLFKVNPVIDHSICLLSSIFFIISFNRWLGGDLIGRTY